MTLEDRGSVDASIAKPAPLLLQEPKSPRGKNVRTQPWVDVDQPDTPRVALDRVKDGSQDRVHRFTVKGIEEVADRELVGDAEFPYVGNDDLYVFAAVLMSARCHAGASDLGQGRSDLDPDDFAKRPACGLMDNATLSASEVHKSVAIGDSQVGERSG